MKLNNKGFAISGILYTVFVVFLLILLYILGALNSKRKILEKNIESINKSIYETCYTIGDSSTQIPASEANLSAITYTGKYTLSTGCVTYAKKGESLIDKDCVGTGKVSSTDTITEICTSEKEN